MNKQFFAKFMIILGFVMVAVYIGLGAILLFFPVYKYIPHNMKIIFGFFFMAYGFFRLIRSIMKLKQYRNE